MMSIYWNYLTVMAWKIPRRWTRAVKARSPAKKVRTENVTAIMYPVAYGKRVEKLLEDELWKKKNLIVPTTNIFLIHSKQLNIGIRFTWYLKSKENIKNKNTSPLLLVTSAKWTRLTDHCSDSGHVSLRVCCLFAVHGNPRIIKC